jgi:hypothetical protein
MARSKYCPDCRGPKPVSAFGRNRQSPDGLHYYCKQCAASRQRTWAKANPEKVRAMRENYLRAIYERNASVDPYAEPS